MHLEESLGMRLKLKFERHTLDCPGVEADFAFFDDVLDFFVEGVFLLQEERCACVLNTG